MEIIPQDHSGSDATVAWGFATPGTDKARSPQNSFYRMHQFYARVLLPNVSFRSVA